MWKCSSGVSRKAPIRAGDHLGHWVVAGAVAEAEAAGDDDGGSGGASGSVAAAWNILREPCAAFARKLVAGKLRRGAGLAGAARAAAATAAAARRDGRARRRRGGRPRTTRGGGLGGRRPHPPRSAAGTRAPAAPGVARLLHRGGLCECGGGGGAPRIPRRPRVRRRVGVRNFNGRRGASGGCDHRPAQAHRLARPRARATAARRARSADGRRRTHNHPDIPDPTAATRSTTSKRRATRSPRIVTTASCRAISSRISRSRATR